MNTLNYIEINFIKTVQHFSINTLAYNRWTCHRAAASSFQAASIYARLCQGSDIYAGPRWRCSCCCHHSPESIFLCFQRACTCFTSTSDSRVPTSTSKVLFLFWVSALNIWPGVWTWVFRIGTVTVGFSHCDFQGWRSCLLKSAICKTFINVRLFKP